MLMVYCERIAIFSGAALNVILKTIILENAPYKRVPTYATCKDEDSRTEVVGSASVDGEKKRGGKVRAIEAEIVECKVTV